MHRNVSARALAALALGAIAFLGAAPVRAQLNRTAVSFTGDDLNSCAPALPCRSFARAMSQTNANGEILVLDSGGYGPFTINRSVTIQAAPGVYAGVTASSGNAITLSLPPSGRAVIRGLTLEGLGTGTWGIYGFAGIVHIENCIVNGFVYGIGIGGYTATISDTEVRNNTTIGIIVANAGSRAILERVRIKNNGTWGLIVQDSAKATIRNSVVAGNMAGLSASSNAVLNIENTEATHNSTGIYSDTGAFARVSNTFVTDNGSAGLRNDNTGTMESWQNNKVRGNLSNFGSGTGAVLTNISQQ
ncbi:MAG: right-handed parallel beta-helix repeat-containing protein [Casimicrobiaceae bacterium]